MALRHCPTIPLSQLVTMSLTLAKERLQSLKIGLLAAGVALLSFLGLDRAVRFLPLPTVTGGMAQGMVPIGIEAAIVLLSGFLFGVTYRYVVRHDRNPHLKSGVVLAFGLVRGLGQLEVGIRLADGWLLLGWFVIESLILFAIVGGVVEVALTTGKVARFPAE
ncbi:hypothetical protein OOK60_12385 [Trichothermofontia sichuanensis B231]|uniref:hypothetical protein n=1 Tax=Trichothermofontia sichuanensis TaxID=3045816 RepID=UPI0022469EFE|nr:hypothetical protein [Trichothermofontia sichuanensis]UZQ53300.1 hypothetical protein OOK60_12385 [Trichothermofontia sichuanensis B231]